MHAISGMREQKQDSKRCRKIVSLNPVAVCRSIAVAPRAYWKGYLKLSLVSCPIAISPAASSSERISFRQINKKTGNRLRQQLVDEETREPVAPEDKGRGYEVDKGVFIEVDDDELEAIQVESRHTIDIDSFVPAAQIDKRFYDNPYYIAPTDNVGQEAFAVIRDAMRGKGMVALGRNVLAKRERVIALEPCGKGMLGTTLRYGYEAALVELLRKKQAGFKPPKTKEHIAAPRNVINLMDALRRSVQAERAAPAPAKKGRKRVEGQREMLLPIEGKQTPQRAAAKKSGARRKAG